MNFLQPLALFPRHALFTIAFCGSSSISAKLLSNADKISITEIRRNILGFENQVDRKQQPPPGGFPIYYVPLSRTVCKRTPLEEPGTNSSRGVLLHTVLDEGT